MKVLLKTLFYFLFVILGIKEILLLKLGFLGVFLNNRDRKATKTEESFIICCLEKGEVAMMNVVRNKELN